MVKFNFLAEEQMPKMIYAKLHTTQRNTMHTHFVYTSAIFHAFFSVSLFSPFFFSCSIFTNHFSGWVGEIMSVMVVCLLLSVFYICVIHCVVCLELADVFTTPSTQNVWLAEKKYYALSQLSKRTTTMDFVYGSMLQIITFLNSGKIRRNGPRKIHPDAFVLKTGGTREKQLQVCMPCFFFLVQQENLYRIEKNESGCWFFKMMLHSKLWEKKRWIDIHSMSMLLMLTSKRNVDESIRCTLLCQAQILCSLKNV